uniref:NADH dehydrogenase subunit 4L n=1 Tax=Eisenia andrei TaxID=168636 RepID=UPI00211548AF|nr:NADH dehydrogenase subunit 4L [Eisenia andrei]UTB53923.1 NADH dehydrogenase subunit 4L [Eisenia andrei]
MYNSIMILVFLLPLVAMLNLISNQTHFLMTLLSLEGITLSLVLFVPLTLSVMSAPNTSVSVMLLTFGACEASIGLSLMVLMSRSFGTDMLNSLTMNKC